MGTPHNEAQTGDIAKTVLMPGDPLRAKYIADNYLTDVICFNTVRNMSGFTGIYNGCRVLHEPAGFGFYSRSCRDDQGHQPSRQGRVYHGPGL